MYKQRRFSDPPLAHEHRLRLALSGLRAGTEVLRTGGGVTLSSEQCNLLSEEYDRLAQQLEQAERMRTYIEAAMRECERASDVRRDRRQLLGNVHLILQDAISVLDGLNDHDAALTPDEGADPGGR